MEEEDNVVMTTPLAWEPPAAEAAQNPAVAAAPLSSQSAPTGRASRRRFLAAWAYWCGLRCHGMERTRWPAAAADDGSCTGCRQWTDVGAQEE